MAKNAAVEVKAEGEVATVEAFAFCSIYAIPTSNPFQPLSGLQDGDRQWLREGHRRSSCGHGPPRGGGQVQQYPGWHHPQAQPTSPIKPNKTVPIVAPACSKDPAYSYPDLPLPGHTIYPPPPMTPTPVEWGGLVGHMSSSVRIPCATSSTPWGQMAAGPSGRQDHLPAPSLK